MKDSADNARLSPREAIDALVSGVGGPDVVRAVFYYAARQSQTRYDGVSLTMPGDAPGGVQLDYYQTTGNVHFSIGKLGTYVLGRGSIEEAISGDGPGDKAA